MSSNNNNNNNGLSFTLSKLSNWLLSGSQVSCAEGMTRIGETPKAADAAQAQSMAQAAQAKEMGLPIGTEGQMSAQQQFAEAELKKKEMEKALGKRTNPGSYEGADANAKRILNPDVQDGLKITINKPVSNMLTSMHEFTLGSTLVEGNPNDYQGQLTYGDPAGSTVVLGRIDPVNKTINGQFIHAKESYVSKVVAHLNGDPARSVLEWDIDYKGSDFTAGAKFTQGPFVSVNYFQSVTKNMAFGGEGLFHGGQGYTHIFGRAKYFDEENEFNATLSTANTFSTSYARKIGQFVHLAAEYEVNLSTRKSLMNCGWEFILRQGQARVSGTISTEGIIATQVAKVVDPMTTVFFKSILDHSKDSHKFGLGVQFGN